MIRLVAALLLVPGIAGAEVSQEQSLVEITDTISTMAANERAKQCYMQNKLTLMAFSAKEMGVPFEKAAEMGGAKPGSEEHRSMKRGYDIEDYLDESLDTFFIECISKR